MKHFLKYNKATILSSCFAEIPDLSWTGQKQWMHEEWVNSPS